jgi:CubicO group peptidase (beta-lactamase class C family)
MSSLAAYRPHLDALLADLAGEHGPPGAVCGVLVGDEVEIVTFGVTNVATGAPVIPGTLFQLGSITKAYTATLVMQAVTAGVVSLDESVRAQLQEFTVADPGATIEITPRHLLTHTSGIEGDHLIDTGWNADALSRYVATLAGLGQIHPTDQAYSFCNTGFAVAGRLLEVATGEHFDRVLRRRLTRPLGCRATLTLPQHALLHSVAVGHVQTRGEPATRQPRWALTRSNGPMGGIMAPAAELLAFARLHVAGGRGPDGADLLPPAVVEAMQQPYVEAAAPGEDQALGWNVTRWGDHACLGLEADTFGQRAMLRVVPEREFAVCVMANSPTGAPLAQRLVEQVAHDLLDVDASGGLPAAVAPATAGPAAGGLAGLAGTYDRLHQRIVVSVAESETPSLVLETEPSGVLQALGVGQARLDVVVVDAGADAPAGHAVCHGTDPVSGQHVVAMFTPPSGHQPAGVYLAGRLHRRVT